MIIPEDNLDFSDKIKKYDKNILEYNYLNNKSTSSTSFHNKLDIFVNVKTNICNLNQPEISLEEIKNIMDSPKIVLEEEDDDSDEIYFTKISKTDMQTTVSLTKNISFVEKKPEKENNLKKSVNFTTILRKKRGRMRGDESNNKNQKLHCCDDFDNIQRKIQVDFISFLIRLANDALKHVFGPKTKYHFKHVNYEIKKIVNHKYIEYLKECNYSDILQMKISPKNKLFKEDSNKKTFIEVCKFSDILKNIFEKKYLYIFQKYYCGIKNNKKIIDLEGLKILLSPKTKTLFNLLKKNEKYYEKYKNVIKDVYFSDINYISDKKFIISSSFLSNIRE